MTDALKQLEEKAKHSPALPQYFRDLLMREITEDTATEDWAKRTVERISFIEQFAQKK